MREMTWIECEGIIDPQVFNEVEKEIGYKLPESYKHMIKDCDGGWPYYSRFKYYDIGLEDIWGAAIATFLKFSSRAREGFMDVFRNPPESFTKGVIAFANTGNGDYICFDYRGDKDNPSVVYWNHECPEDSDISPLAPSFEEFIDMLEPYEEIS
jgi:hypothetical protein